MTLPELIRSRRSIRSYQERAVPDDLLSEVLDLARHAPSSMNDQPWRFIVVREARLKRGLAQAKSAHSPDAKRTAYPADFLARAPVVIAVCVDRRRAHQRGRESGILATAFLLLAAHDAGLGAVYLSAYQSQGEALELEIRRLLALPPEIEPVTLVPLGFPAEMPAPKPLRPLSEQVQGLGAGPAA
jgi:nitroreductase